MSRFTPGPWAVRGSAGTSVYLLQNYGFSASGWAIHNVSEAQAQADARLIAAAPDLLAALKEAVEIIDNCTPYDAGKARDAIDKAEGRS